jgi:hypothetical protein
MFGALAPGAEPCRRRTRQIVVAAAASRPSRASWSLSRRGAGVGQASGIATPRRFSARVTRGGREHAAPKPVCAVFEGHDAQGAVVTETTADVQHLLAKPKAQRVNPWRHRARRHRAELRALPPTFSGLLSRWPGPAPPAPGPRPGLLHPAGGRPRPYRAPGPSLLRRHAPHELLCHGNHLPPPPGTGCQARLASPHALSLPALRTRGRSTPSSVPGRDLKLKFTMS